jgi:YHS domain-containing protein
MYVVRLVPRVVGAAILTFFFMSDAAAQTTPAPAEQQHEGHTAPAAAQEGHDMAAMAREGSGTSWLPDESPMYAIHAQKGSWMLMFHENAFLQYLHESGTRGDDQAGSINWVMGMAQRPAGPGKLGLRGMFSAEPWTIRGCGYPDLLASGERCDGEPIHDRQHPHDLFMELAASYDAPLKGATRWQVYAAPAGEPALGPVAFPHRLSAMPSPLAPISHHWMDATHISFGVLTGGVYGHRWKAEASAFNGREPDEDRAGFDFGALDSVSGRFWFLPTSKLALQVSVGQLTEAEPSETGGPGTDVTRATASATYHSAFRDKGIWATTIGWGRNAEPGHASNALLLESSLTFSDRDSWYGRFEAVGKSAHDLVVAESGEDFTVAKLQGGYTRYLPAWNGFQPGLGGGMSLGVVPESLKAAYGSRTNFGFALYLTLRPAAMMHGTQSAAPAAVDHSQHVMPESPPASPASGAARDAAPRTPSPAGEPRLPVIEAERVIDPACASSIDLVNAPRAAYQGKVYYFCSAADRDTFLKDPSAYLKRRGQ